MENFDGHQRGRFGLSVSGFFQSGGVGRQVSFRIRHDYAAPGTQMSEADAVDDFVRRLAVAVAPDLRVGADAADYHLRFKADMDAAAARLRV